MVLHIPKSVVPFYEIVSTCEVSYDSPRATVPLEGLIEKGVL